VFTTTLIITIHASFVTAIRCIFIKYLLLKCGLTTQMYEV